jgi:ATPase family AAA domain-containing protein 3A/B
MPFSRGGCGIWLAGATWLLTLREAGGNWLLQCSSCVDQSFFSDDNLKENVKDADLPVLLGQLKQLRLREFDHREDEFFNKFFSKRQLGIITQEIQSIMPSAVATLPERRWTNTKGMSNMTKNVMMLRESHILMVAVGSLQHLARKADLWDASVDQLQREMVDVQLEQDENRRKREGILEQVVRTIAKVEVLQHTLVKTEGDFVRLDADTATFRTQQDEKHLLMQQGMEEIRNATLEQDRVIADFKEEFREAVDREARADLVEKRKTAETELEVERVKKEIEQVRWAEEQKTISMREEELRKSEDHSSKLHQARVAHELEEKKRADLELMREQEASNLRQEEVKRQGEKELLLLRLQSDERRAEMGVQEAIERAKVEEEAKIKAARENEDVNLRAMQAEMAEKREQTLAAIRETADIALSWISFVFRSPANLALGIGTIVTAIGGVYLAREMAILLREQLNKRLGRPSLVRMTNRRGMLQEAWIGLLRLLRLRGRHGSEFNDVVLHPRLHQQVMRLADATRSAKARRMPLQHAMFYGPPGTGKTMVAQRFAEYSGLEYAIMAGGDVAPLQEQAVTELHSLFKWVHRSRRGVLLFIDEADAFLASRTKTEMSEALRNALTTILYHTGTPSSQFMLVIATNRPGDLDSAILDRLDESVEFGLPDVEARRSMVKLYFEKYVARPLQIKLGKPGEAVARMTRTSPLAAAAGPKASKVTGGLLEAPQREEATDEAALGEAAERLHGFSGREISKLFTSLQTHVLYATNQREVMHHLPKSLLFEVVDQKVKEHDKTHEFQVSGYHYHNSEAKSLKTSSRNGAC